MKKIFQALFLLVFVSTPAFASPRPITPGEVAAIALKNNYDIRTARFDKEIFALNLDFAKIQYDGRFTFDTGYTIDQTEQTISQFFGSDVRTFTFGLGYSKLFPTGTGFSVSFDNIRQSTDSTFVTINPYYDTALEFGISQPLLKNFGGMQNRYTVRMARTDVDILNLSVQQRIEASLYEALIIYWDMYLAHTSMEISRKALEKSRRLVSNARNKLKRGLFEKGDVYAFEALNSQRESSYLKAKQAYEDLVNVLKYKLALSDKNAELVPSEKPSLSEIDLSFDNNAKEAFDNRRDYREVMKRVEKNDLELKMYRNAKYPRLDFITSLKANGLSDGYGGAIADVPKFANPRWFIGLEMELNTNNTEARANYSRANIEKARNLVEVKKIESKIEDELARAIRQMKVGRENALKTRSVRKYQALKLKEEERKFSQGRSRSETVINYEDDLLNAQLAETAALVDYEKSLIGLLFKKNTLLSRFLD